jgi:hypothetical protein
MRTHFLEITSRTQPCFLGDYVGGKKGRTVKAKATAAPSDNLAQLRKRPRLAALLSAMGIPAVPATPINNFYEGVFPISCGHSHWVGILRTRCVPKDIQQSEHSSASKSQATMKNPHLELAREKLLNHWSIFLVVGDKSGWLLPQVVQIDNIGEVLGLT